MVCGNCGKMLEEGERFCPACGTRVEQVPQRSVETVQPERYNSVTYTPDAQQPSAYTVQYSSQPAAGPEEPQSISYKRADAKEKEFFGKGAFLLCLFIIGFLAGTAGAFAYLYFSLVGVI